MIDSVLLIYNCFLHIIVIIIYLFIYLSINLNQ